MIGGYSQFSLVSQVSSQVKLSVWLLCTLCHSSKNLLIYNSAAFLPGTQQFHRHFYVYQVCLSMCKALHVCAHLIKLSRQIPKIFNLNSNQFNQGVNYIQCFYFLGIWQGIHNYVNTKMKSVLFTQKPFTLTWLWLQHHFHLSTVPITFKLLIGRNKAKCKIQVTVLWFFAMSLINPMLLCKCKYHKLRVLTSIIIKSVLSQPVLLQYFLAFIRLVLSIIRLALFTTCFFNNSSRTALQLVSSIILISDYCCPGDYIEVQLYVLYCLMR